MNEIENESGPEEARVHKPDYYVSPKMTQLGIGGSWEEYLFLRGWILIYSKTQLLFLVRW